MIDLSKSTPTVRFSCYICGAEKRDVNRWFVAQVRTDLLKIEHFAEAKATKADCVSICGETCLHTLVSRVGPIIAGTVTPPTEREEQ